MDFVGYLKYAALPLVRSHKVASADRPDVQVLIERARGQQLSIGGERHRVHWLVVLCQVMQAHPALGIPQPVHKLHVLMT